MKTKNIILSVFTLVFVGSMGSLLSISKEQGDKELAKVTKAFLDDKANKWSWHCYIDQLTSIMEKVYRVETVTEHGKKVQKKIFIYKLENITLKDGKKASLISIIKSTRDMGDTLTIHATLETHKQHLPTLVKDEFDKFLGRFNTGIFSLKAKIDGAIAANTKIKSPHQCPKVA